MLLVAVSAQGRTCFRFYLLLSSSQFNKLLAPSLSSGGDQVKRKVTCFELHSFWRRKVKIPGLKLHKYEVKTDQIQHL
jgi:hypothetical protein